MNDFSISDRVSWMTVNGVRLGSVAEFTERGIVIHLDNGKVIVANSRSLTKV